MGKEIRKSLLDRVIIVVEWGRKGRRKKEGDPMPEKQMGNSHQYKTASCFLIEPHATYYDLGDLI
jgi:hypothetical protein